HQSSKEYRALPGRHHCAHRSVCIHSNVLRALAHHLVRFCAQHGICILGIPFQSTQTHRTVEKQGTPFRRILRRERTHHRGREQRCARCFRRIRNSASAVPDRRTHLRSQHAHRGDRCDAVRTESTSGRDRVA